MVRTIKDCRSHRSVFALLEMAMLAKHGVILPVNMQGLTEDQITDLKLKDEYADKCIPMDGYVDEEDGTGKRNGRGKDRLDSAPYRH